MISFIWVLFALFTCAILPVWEARGFFRDFWREVKVSKRVGGDIDS